MANSAEAVTMTSPAIPDTKGGESSHKRGRRNRIFRFICLSLGMLLLVAAALKFSDTSWEPFGQLLIVPPRVRFILVEVEIVVALWLLTGLAPAFLRLGAAMYFTLLAMASLVLAINGEPSCGCFGRATVNPWLTFALDIVAIVALIAVRPAGYDRNLLRLIRRHAVVLSWIGVSLALITAGAVFHYGGVEPAWVTLLGDSVTVDPPLTEIGDAPIGTQNELRVTLRNRLDRPVQILGGTSNCSCAATKDLPLTLQPHGSAEVRVIGVFSGETGPFVREFGFYTDLGFGHQTTGRFRGRVIPRNNSRP